MHQDPVLESFIRETDIDAKGYVAFKRNSYDESIFHYTFGFIGNYDKVDVNAFFLSIADKGLNLKLLFLKTADITKCCLNNFMAYQRISHIYLDKDLKIDDISAIDILDSLGFISYECNCEISIVGRLEEANDELT